MRAKALILACLCCAVTLAQDAPPSPSGPVKAPKPKSRLKLLQQMQMDLDMASKGAKVDDKGRKKLDKCHQVLIDAVAQQQRYKSINYGKVNGCLNDFDTLDDAGAFAEADRDKLRKDRDSLGEVLGKSHRIRLPSPL
jgi:hypothetical protein